MKLKFLGILTLILLLIFSCKNADKDMEKADILMDSISSKEYKDNEVDSVPERTTDQNNFKGVGTEPFWSVEIEDKKIYFQSPNEKYEAISGQVDQVDVAGDTMTFISESGSDHIQITLIKEKCSDGMSDRTYSHRVEIDIKRNIEKEPLHLQGCGYFIEK